VQAYADGLLVIPKTLALNAGYDPQEVMVKLIEEGSAGQKVSHADVVNMIGSNFGLPPTSVSNSK
jgi:T-complex protein 1 subunit zeta